MAKQRKESKPCSLRMDADVYAVLEKYCEKSGQSKTVAIERGIMLLAKEYEKHYHEEASE